VPRVRFQFDQDRRQPVEFDVGFGSNLYRASLARSLSLFNGPMKLLNCWGKGLCGACFVEVVRGAENLPDRTSVERKKLAKSPDTIRLACQVLVTGDLVIRKPSGILRPRLKGTRKGDARHARDAARAGEASA
jgi:ferredoxin